MSALYDQSYTKEERFGYKLNFGYQWMKAKYPNTRWEGPSDVVIVFRDRKLVDVQHPGPGGFTEYAGYWTMMGGIVEAIKEIQDSWEAKK